MTAALQLPRSTSRARLAEAFAKLRATRVEIRDIYRGEPWTTKPKSE